MGKKAGTIKAKKGSKAQDDKMKTEAGQETTPVPAVVAAPKNRGLGFLHLAKGGKKPRAGSLQESSGSTGQG